MFEKRLFSLVPQATPYIMASVLFKWIALMANITVMWMLALSKPQTGPVRAFPYIERTGRGFQPAVRCLFSFANITPQRGFARYRQDSFAN